MKWIAGGAVLLGTAIMCVPSPAAADEDEAHAVGEAAGLTSDLCFSQQFSDPDEADDSVLDVVTYEMGFDCHSYTFVAAITTSDAFTLDQMWTYRIDIDTNGNLNDGCRGAEYVAALTGGDGPDEASGGFFRSNRGCDSLNRIGELEHSRTSDDTLIVQIWGQSTEPVGAPGQTLRWQQTLSSRTPGDPADAMPDGSLSSGNHQSTPADPCNGGCFWLTDSTTGATTDVVFRDPQPASQVLVGDWNADGGDSFGFRTGSTYALKDALAPTAPDRTFGYGQATDVALVGDWNGDGTDTIGVRRGNTFYLRNSLSGGAADVTIAYGSASDIPLVGDWNGDGVDTPGVRRGNTYYLKNTLSGGSADVVVTYGQTGDLALVGDWDGDGDDSIGVRRYDHYYYLRNSLSAGPADLSFVYTGERLLYGLDTVVGDWNADGTDTVGVHF